MKKQFLRKSICVLLSLLLTASLLCCGAVTAFASGEEDAEETSGEVLITLSDAGSACVSEAVTVEGDTVTIAAAGTYRVTGTLSEGQLVVAAPKDAKVKLVLDGAAITCTGSAAILALSADRLTVSAAAGSENSLRSKGAFYKDDKVDAALYAKCDLTLSGEGALTVVSDKGHGIVTKDDLRVKGGEIGVTAAKKGVEGKDSVSVEGGALLIEAGTKGLCSENEEGGYVGIEGGSVTVRSGGDSIHAAGDIAISGGTLLLTSGDDAVHADAALTVSGGSLTVLESEEGLEAQSVEISGGAVDVTASDDGINAAGGSDSGRAENFGPFGGDSSAFVTISGGAVNIDAGGDGIDSNGGLYVSGGVLTVSGPTNNGNGALDFGTEAVVTGGTVIAAGASGMAVNFGAASTQGSILLVFDVQKGGSSVTVTDEKGEVLASFTPAKSYNSVVVSAEGMTLGGSYTVTAGSFSETVTLDTLSYGGGTGFGGFGGFGGGPGWGGPQGGQGRP